jgi:hypothetical protein
MFFVYILRSVSTGIFYTGQTSDLDTRLGQHNLGLSKSTRGGGPWILIHSESFELVTISLAADGVDERVAAHSLAAFQRCKDEIALGIDANLLHLFP